MNHTKSRLIQGFTIAAITCLAIVTAVPSFASAAPKNINSNASVKNVIVLISDGWGYNHIEATNYYQYGKTGSQVYEKFPTKTGMSTYEVENDGNIYGYLTKLAWGDFDYVKTNATDSASAATAMSTGVKTRNGRIGVGPDGETLKHIIEYAEELGKATGVVTSVEFSHATPAGFVAHNITRNDYAGIANEMIYQSAVDVIMGCGAPDYDNNGDPQDPTSKEKYVGGATTWADITDDFNVTGADANGDGVADSWVVIRDRAGFQAMSEGDTATRVLGIPYVYTTLQQSRSGDGYSDPYVVPLIETVPTLEEMTRAALNILDNDKDGFFLMVEGGAVDWASHASQSGRMIEEQIDFNMTVEAVVDWVIKNSNWGETLVIVTGDHECGYLTGPNSDPGWEAVVNNGAGNLPGMEWHSGDHTNNIIPFFAKGDVARLFKSAADEKDIVRGKYIDNIEIGQTIIAALK
ncbi:MAG: alkaline phosphatase [Dehalococcoidaceae bacterium]|nr:alkaline phosphatase [Dehalococcoidaceae bacterium]